MESSKQDKPHSKLIYILTNPSTIKACALFPLAFILINYSVTNQSFLDGFTHLAAFSKYPIPNATIHLIFKHSDTFNTTLDEKISENNIEGVNLEITKLFSCKHHCTAENPVPELSERKVLRKQWPNEVLHKKWGSRNGYIAGLHIYNNTELTTEEDDGLLKEARNYVETFWKNHTEKNPLQFDAAKFEDPIPELYSAFKNFGPTTSTWSF